MLSTCVSATKETESSLPFLFPLRQTSRKRNSSEWWFRYGERTVCTVNDEDGNETGISVTEYIHYDLAQDDLSLKHPGLFPYAI